MLIEPLRELSDEDARRLIVGYTTPKIYRYSKSETRERTEIAFELVEQPFEKRFPLPPMMIAYYRAILSGGLSFKATEDDAFIGLTVADTQWNGIAIVWELHVDPLYRRRGIGRALLEAVEGAARSKKLRMVSIEVQSTNVPALDFYRACGYEIGAIDTAFYSNDDAAKGEIDVFMRKAL